MNARQSVLIAMFISLAIFMTANISQSSITRRVDALKQVPG